MSGELNKVDRTPVAEADLKWLPRMGHALFVPSGCLECSVLTVTSAAQKAGVRVLTGSLNGKEDSNYTMVVPGGETAAQEVLDKRALAAASGACIYAANTPGCWRQIAEAGQGQQTQV
ncbi:MAG TPA: hypothetical protein VG604_02845 [Candidatus Saccharimonadales bacterium]|nr:hypothetical protein [Candidatus Saccharimonadales bacterium]